MVVFFIVFRERPFLCSLFGKYRIRMKFLQPLISRISSGKRIFFNRGSAFFVQPKVMGSPLPECGCNNFVFAIDDQLRFLGVTFLFAGIVLFLKVFPPFF